MTTPFLALLIGMVLLAQVTLISFFGWRRQRARFLALGQSSTLIIPLLKNGIILSEYIVLSIVFISILYNQ